MRVKTNGSKGHFEGGEGLELHEVYEEVSGPGEIPDQRGFGTERWKSLLHPTSLGVEIERKSLGECKRQKRLQVGLGMPL